MSKRKQHKLARKLKRNRPKKLVKKGTETIPESYFGYDSAGQLQCMVAQVTNDHLKEFEVHGISDFHLDDWFISFGDCSSLEIAGPFNSSESALEYCRDMHQINHFDYQPLIESTYPEL